MPTQVTRNTPQSLLGETVSLATAGELAALFDALLPFGWKSNNQTDATYSGGWRLTINSPVRAAQFAYVADELLIIDATWDDTNGWTVSAATDVIVYSAVSTGPSVDDFNNTFSPVTG